ERGGAGRFVDGLRRPRAGQVGDLDLVDRDGGADERLRWRGLVLDGDGDGVGAFLRVGVRRRVDAEIIAAGVDHRAGGGGAVAPVDGRRVVGGWLGAGGVGEGRDAGDRGGAAPVVYRLWRAGAG